MPEPAPLNILHLEDSPRDAALVDDRLRDAGVGARVAVVRSRAEFEDALIAMNWDLILCDYNIPGYDGLTALKRARSAQPRVPVIMLSGSISPEEAVECMREGATDYLLKQRSERLPSAVNRAIREVEDRRRRLEAESALRENEERLRLALSAAGMEAWEVDLRTGKIRLPRQTSPGGGGEERTAEGDLAAWLERIHPEDREKRQAAFNALVREGAPYAIEYRTLLPGGAIRWMAVWGTLVRDNSGEPVRVIGVSQEITERKQAQAATLASLREKEALLKEIHHRVKNNLQVIASLIRLESGRLGDNTGAITGMTGRIQSMALLHESLYRSQSFDEVSLDPYLHQIVNSVLRAAPVDRRTATVSAAVERVNVSIDQAIPCGLIVNELAANCMRHAFVEGSPLVITLEVSKDRATGDIRLRVGDNGPGLPEDFEQRRKGSLGLQLVGDLVRQLQGRLEIESRHGASFQVVFRETPVREWMPPRFNA